MGKIAVDTMVLLDRCAEIELKNMELYELYADCFAHDADVARMWSRVAREEENHANQFRLAVKMKEGAIGTVNVDQWRADNTLNVVESIIDGVKRSLPTLEEALRSAIKLEEHLSGFHVECVVNFENEQLRKLFHAMMACDNAHVDRLRNAYEHQLKARGR